MRIKRMERRSYARRILSSSIRSMPMPTIKLYGPYILSIKTPGTNNALGSACYVAKESIIRAIWETAFSIPRRAARDTMACPMEYSLIPPTSLKAYTFV